MWPWDFDIIQTMKIMKALLLAVAFTAASTACAATCIVDAGVFSGEPAVWASAPDSSASGSPASSFDGRMAAAGPSNPQSDGFMSCDTRLYSFLSVVLEIFNSTEPKGLMLLVF